MSGLWRRRLRGMVGTTLTWCTLWAGLGLLFAASQFAIRRFSHSPFGGEEFFFGLSLLAASWGIWGAITGLLFGVTIAVTQRRKAFQRIRYKQFAVLGALTGASIPSLQIVISVLTANSDRVPNFLVSLAIGTGVGALCAMGTLWTARRAGSGSLNGAEPLEAIMGSSPRASAAPLHELEHVAFGSS